MSVAPEAKFGGPCDARAMDAELRGTGLAGAHGSAQAMRWIKSGPI
jgi:hypothetical protein